MTETTIPTCPKCGEPATLQVTSGQLFCSNAHYWWPAVPSPAGEAPTRHIEGTWPADCVQRVFVDGAKWWEYHKSGATMWPSDRDLAEAEAVRRYGTPASSPPAAAPTHDSAGEYHDYITCPHCGETDHETTEYPRSLRGDGDSAQYSCDACDRTFRVTLAATYEYRADPITETVVEGPTDG